MNFHRLYNYDNRIEYIDLARGIAIILVLIGHVMMIYDSPFNDEFSVPHNLVYSFHIPLFFFISGICFSNKPISFSSFLKKKVRSLIVPYCTFSLIWYFYEVITGVFIYKKALSVSYLGGKMITFIFQIRHLSIWFLTCLFLVEILFFLILKISQRKKEYVVLLSLIVTALGLCYRLFIGVNLIWNFDVALIMVVFTAAGYLFKSFDTSNIKDRYYLILGIVLLILNQVLNFINLKYFEPHVVDVFCNYYGDFALFFVSAFLGVFSIVFLSVFGARHFPLLKYIGQNSLIIYALHPLIFRICETLLSRFSFSYVQLYIIWTVVILFTIILFTVITYLVVNSPLCVLIGKKYERKSNA